MNILVIGAGAIGSLYGAKLSELNEVTLIARKGHADIINKKGLRIEGIENKTYKLNAKTEADAIDDNSFILLTTKVQDSKNAINSIKSLVKEDTIILCVQNGLYSENIVKEIIGSKCLVLRAVTNFGAAFLENGIVQYNNKGRTLIEKSPHSKNIAEIFSKCGLGGAVSEDIKRDIWKKLIVNCAVNPLTAILRVKNGEIADERLNPLKKLIIDECLKAAEKEGMTFKMDFLKAINDGIKGSENISSMLQDLMKGRKTEIDYLNGAVVEAGRKRGIMCPVNASIAAIIKEMEK